MELVVWIENLILLVLTLASAVCVGPVSRVVCAPVVSVPGAFRMALRHASRPRLLPVDGDPGSRSDFVL